MIITYPALTVNYAKKFNSIASRVKEYLRLAMESCTVVVADSLSLTQRGFNLRNTDY